MKKSKNNLLIVGMDVGSTAIRVAVGQQTGVQENSGGSDLQIIGMVEVPSEGIHKGVVNSIEETVSSITNALEQTERLVGVPIESAWVGISGHNIISQESRGVVSVAKSNGEISSEDLKRAVESARTTVIPLNYDILHVIPKNYNVDGQMGIKDPVGMTGIRLEANVQIIYGMSSFVKNITKAIYRTGIDIEDLVLSILATGETVTTSKQRELGVAVVNIGSSTTNLVVYEDGNVLHTATLPVGSEHVTNDLAIGLKTSIEIAEKIKIEYGNCVSDSFSKKEKINLQNFGSSENEFVPLQYVSEIIEARMTEILEKINKELTKIMRSGKLPAGVIFTGGGAKIQGLLDLSKNVLSLPAAIGYPLYINSIQNKTNDIAFVPAIGMVKWGMHLSQENVSVLKKYQTPANLVKKVKDIWKSLIP